MHYVHPLSLVQLRYLVAPGDADCVREAKPSRAAPEKGDNMSGRARRLLPDHGGGDGCDLNWYMVRSDQTCHWKNPIATVLLHNLFIIRVPSLNRNLIFQFDISPFDCRLFLDMNLAVLRVHRAN